MLSRIFWVGIAGIALVVGMVVQDGGWIFDSVERELSIERDVDAQVERIVDAQVQRAVDGGFDQMEVVGADGREIDVPSETKRALGIAVGALVKAEASLAMAKIGDENPADIRAAEARRAEARAEVDRLKAEIKDLEQAAAIEQDAVREQVRSEIREDIRATVREAVRN